MRRLYASAWFQGFVVVAACAAVFLPLLGSSGFAQTEGHRVIPGWTMARTGAWDRLELFGAPYLAKPPGLPLLIGASAAALGESEFSARLPSAVCMTLGAVLMLIFARRWFGAAWGLPAGLAHALTPWFWAPARSAEIESLHQLGVQAACFCALTLLLGAARRGRAAALVLLGAAGVFVMIMAKGPVGLPALAGALAAAVVVRRSIAPLGDWRVAIMVVAGAGAAVAALVPFGPPFWFFASATGEVGGQLWRVRELGDIAALPFAAFIAAMPASLALVFPWGPDARLEGRSGPDEDARRAHDFARGLAIAWVATIALYMLLGTGNHRYALPAAVFVPALVGYVVRGVCIVPDGFLPLRRKIARVMLLGRGWGWLTLLTLGAAAWIPLSELQRDHRSGRAAGERLAEMLPDGVTVRARSLVDAVPETLLYAQRGAERRGRRVHIVPRIDPPQGRSWLGPTVLVIRHDAESEEWIRYGQLARDGYLEPMHSDSVRWFTFTAYTSKER